MWSSQGIISSNGFRPAPSAGALYPLESCLVSASIKGIVPGIYKFNMHKMLLENVLFGDKRIDFCNACLRQSSLKSCAAATVICGIYERTTKKYGDIGKIYLHVEVDLFHKISICSQNHLG